MIEDAELIQRHLRGERDAFPELIKRYQQMLYGYLVRMTRNRTDADDLFQETFIRVLRQLPSYDERSRFKSLLFTIAANLCVDHARKRQTRQSHLVEEDPDQGIDTLGDPSGDWIPDRMLEQKEVAETLVKAVDSLPEPQRELVLLRLETGMTFQEIADLKQEPLGTVLARMHRAVAKIRVYFQEHGHDTAA
ncbi:MAG: sigma-70 family RNA polymerase sigma factor [Candidatus Delongbacteria bacterium]|nr:sigma-70 family RNA polymerase sigma factor [Candidatus Cloacimonadota bacterium]MCA9787757.1 sigma-70 family RNA polymerase sigma factor [Candidatus Cloacimonadota bacterium]MCB9475069.1 sigma-70 family RNA polymerase sigma factor [Candidatus Delongbacteria bacterium]